MCVAVRPSLCLFRDAFCARDSVSLNLRADYTGTQTNLKSSSFKLLCVLFEKVGVSSSLRKFVWVSKMPKRLPVREFQKLE